MMSQASPRRGVVAVFVNLGRWLVIQRSASVKEAPGAFCFPGGGIERGESEEQALVREMQEELRIAAAPVARLWSSQTTWGVELAWWQAQLLAPIIQIDPDLEEVASVQWLRPEEIGVLPDLLPSNHGFLEAWRRGEFTLTE